MIIGIGCDIVKITRIKQAHLAHGEHFLRRIYTPHELARMPEGKQQYPYLAKRFAAKEALAKAIGTGIGSTLAFVDIEVYNNVGGAPKLRLLTGVEMLQGAIMHLSLADDGGMALAYVIIERVDGL